MTASLHDALSGFDTFVLLYGVALNASYLLLIGLAAFDALHYFRRLPYSGDQDVFANPLTPAISIIVPAFNEQETIVDCLHGLLNLHYPQYELIIVDDGSTDETFERLRRELDLVHTPKVIRHDVPTVGCTQSVHIPRHGEPVTVIRKVNAGKANGSNAGINAARFPLICFIDADSILDKDALLHVVKPFVEDPGHVVATGGCVRVANGSVVSHGEIVDARMPRGWLARIQVIEYLRAFLMGRAGWSRLRGLLIISGAFGLFRRDVLVEVGGYDSACAGEDAELVARLHHHLRRARRRYEIVFIAEPVCWTEVPSTFRDLGDQRRRWSRGLAETLTKHRAMAANPRYGRMGLVVIPYFVLFELLTPIVEVTGIAAVTLGLALGVVNVPFALLFFTVWIGFGVLLSITALAIEEFSYHRYRRWRDFGLGLAAALLENVGFRQLHAWWRLQGLLNWVIGHPLHWRSLERHGFDNAQSSPRGVD
jgi:cellulose synthase/poly-beta-1,6-N-acetylglucosamine synthase-like glycosyltransferase